MSERPEYHREQWLVDNGRNITMLALGLACVLVFTLAGVVSALEDGDIRNGPLTLLGIVFGGGVAAKAVQGMKEVGQAKAENPQPAAPAEK